MVPTITTKRLILRNISLNDASDMFEYAKTLDVGPMAGWEPHRDVNETFAIINLFKANGQKTGLGTFAIVYKENNKMIGTVELFNHYANFKADLGYSLNPAYWGQGIMVEACEAVLRFGFEMLNLKRIQVSLFSDNYQSERVCQKLGMTYEGIERNSYMRYDRKIFDLKIYSMTNKEYEKKRDELL